MAVIASVDELAIQLLHPDARPPARTRSGDAGYDLACVEPFELAQGERAMVPTGVAVAIPPGMCGLVLPRSGLAIKHGISCVNAPGLVDPNYRGELRVILINHGTEPFSAEAGDRIAQLLIVPFASPVPVVVEELPDGGDDRGTGGFGSSGR
ncbi:dUTP diphosphatase [Solirubrobacter ginsenosidimutans]|uniref:dUTP diphosphatase n=1 Tax=Solirubrobacter ginsenosidimutans TaxID=490573 RepID=A0A9X3MYW4_9ACTN|nr:dUTP diphosphatase [Solirubrobacter ginsenosidimutans]MDA0165072.1 dUTP diphosphatase [Solirubrobacter ginsenosidimutans]